MCMMDTRTKCFFYVSDMIPQTLAYQSTSTPYYSSLKTVLNIANYLLYWIDPRSYINKFSDDTFIAYSIYQWHLFPLKKVQF
jgi:hypothetical protein